MTKPKIGFIGLGQMGLPMAQNVLKAGFPLWVYNRTKDKAQSLLEKGARLASSPKELAAACDIIITMVSNDDVLKTIIEEEHGVVHGAKKELIHISMSTVSPMLIESMEKGHKERGFTLLTATVSGRPERAQAGSLWIFLSGDSAAKKTVQPLLATMGCTIYDLGEKPSQAAIFKLCSNFMILSLIESLSEAMTMLEKNGIPPEKASEIWGSSLFDAPIFHSYSPILCKRNFNPGGFLLELGLKDMRLLRDCADKDQVPMPVLSELHEKLIASMNLGRAKYDWSAIALLTRELAGLDSPPVK